MKGNIPARIFASHVSLNSVDLSNNLFDGHFSFFSFANLSKLEFINFSNNEKLFIHLDSGKFIPSFQLQYLMLSHCNLDSSILATPNFLASQYALEHLDLSSSNLTGNFSNWSFENLTNLEMLNLRNNSIMGEFQLPKHPKTNIFVVDLSMNSLSGSIPVNFGTMFPLMMALNLSSNNLSGKVPSLDNMSLLEYLDLSNNNLSGELPTRLLIGCSKLFILKLSNNKLQGELPRYPQASFIYLDGNNFTGTLSSFVSNKQFVALDVHNNQLSGVIPEDIGRVSILASLNLAGNHFHGHIPHQLCNLAWLSVLDVSHNSLSGSLPHCLPSSELLHLKFTGNAFTGTIPSSYFSISSLVTLDVKNNQLSGKLPRQIGERISLEILILGGNSLEGTIPIELCKIQSLHILDLSQNNLSGGIPSCFGKMHFKQLASIYYTYMDRYNRLNMSFDAPGMHYTYTNRDSNEKLVVELNIKGNLCPYVLDHSLLMSTIDLSANKLTGHIPPEIGNLNELVQLNLSHNQLTGPIPETFSKLGQIESLDISHNRLSGVIPWQLTQLTFLGVFSVAYNNLSGYIPDVKGQLSTFDVSSYVGNIGLHGPPLEKTCTSDSGPTKVEENQDDSRVVDDAIFFAILAASFVAGFWGCIAFLLCHHSGQNIQSILDGYVDYLTDRILMAAHKRARMQRNRR
ncbi:receptor-like protein 1 [Phoenix dactylifera]|uniref:Receptor-like protein 1 n=1 Tax=Phoenix dactylifera TaxID=42345 RepID=A0A8B7BKM2_PHODC|nr:receptor-like protein 1 [Phoenix dactylifera]